MPIQAQLCRFRHCRIDPPTMHPESARRHTADPAYRSLPRASGAPQA